MTRRSFFARMRKLGFEKSAMQLTRVGISYKRGDTLVTVPNSHEGTVMILGGEWSGTYTTHPSAWGTHVNPADLGKENLLEVVYGMFTGEIVKGGE